MDRRQVMHGLIEALAFELLQEIQVSGSGQSDRWVPAANVKRNLQLNFVAVPVENEPRGEKGWLFAILARILEDKGLLEYKKMGGRAFYRSTPSAT